MCSTRSAGNDVSGRKTLQTHCPKSPMDPATLPEPQSSKDCRKTPQSLSQPSFVSHYLTQTVCEECYQPAVCRSEQKRQQKREHKRSHHVCCVCTDTTIIFYTTPYHKHMSHSHENYRSLSKTAARLLFTQSVAVYFIGGLNETVDYCNLIELRGNLV